MGRKIDLPCAKLLSPKDISLAEYHRKRNTILFIRDTGGLGDILMMRMLFEDFKRKMPDAHIVVAAPLAYHGALVGHPFIDEVVDSSEVKVTDYLISYDITRACGKYESAKAPFADKHRSDIWAEHCGVELEHHNMHLTVPDDITTRCREKLAELRTNQKSPIVLFAPVSAMRSKDLDEKQAQGIIDGLKDIGCTVVCFHKRLLPDLAAPTITAKSIIDFFGFINASDYIVSVDTASFHAAGGLKKPQVGIFSWADGKVYGKWYQKVILVQRHRDDGNWDCGPCYVWWRCLKETKCTRKPCITTIRPQEVIEATKKMMKQWPLEAANGR